MGDDSDEIMTLTIRVTENQIKALCELMDMALKANGLAAAERAGYWVQTMQKAMDTAKAESESAVTGFPRAV